VRYRSATSRRTRRFSPYDTPAPGILTQQPHKRPIDRHGEFAAKPVGRLQLVWITRPVQVALALRSWFPALSRSFWRMPLCVRIAIPVRIAIVVVDGIVRTDGHARVSSAVIGVFFASLCPRGRHDSHCQHYADQDLCNLRFHNILAVCITHDGMIVGGTGAVGASRWVDGNGDNKLTGQSLCRFWRR
jgi:hypothetical protein